MTDFTETGRAPQESAGNENTSKVILLQNITVTKDTLPATNEKRQKMPFL